MDKIKCPHCGAMNQDVTAKDNCWKCGKLLSASAAPETAPVGEVDAGGQKLKTQLSLEERVAQRKQERLAARRANPAILVLVALLLLVIALLLYFFVFHHR